jgi:parallel beta-helix repeat protein
MKTHNHLLVGLVITFWTTTVLSPLFAQEHKPDAYTLLLLHCNGNLKGAQGETPTQALGVTFEPGIFGNGAYFAPGNQVYFSSAGNISSTEGTLEFWIKPRWNGNDGQGYVVLRFGVGGGMYVAKDGANNWRSIFNRFGVGSPEVGVAFNVSAWQANQWHHAAFTWKSDVLKLYVDGQLLSQFPVTVPLNVVNESTFQLGADFNTYYLDAVVDELRLSDIERSAQEIQASFLAGQPDPFTVTNTSDSGPGSLRQALLNANAKPGKDQIRFKIPGKGPHTIQPLSALPTITDPVVIDGATQPGYAGKPVIELDGSNAGAGTNGMHITAGNSTVQGLVINRFGSNGIEVRVNGGNVIRGNFLGTDVSGTVALGNFRGILIDNSNNNNVGGTTPVARNLVSGNFDIGVNIVGGATGNVVQGNFIGTDVSGTARLGNGTGVDVAIGAFGNTIGGATPGARNLISGNVSNGIRLDSPGATDNKVEGNYIGTDVTGNTALGNQTGVLLAAARNSIIKGNVISGNSGIGIDIDFSASGNKMLGNLIGTNAKGTKALGNLSDGIDMPGGNNNLIAENVIADNAIGIVIRGDLTTGNLVQGNYIGIDRSRTIPLGNRGEGMKIFASNNTIGGTHRSKGNTIAFNGGGVNVFSGTGNAILANSIFSNSTLGIDLGVDGVTANDVGDEDLGANNLQNFPVLTSAIGGSKIKIQGTLNSTPNTSFRLEFFSNPDCDPSNHGEGKKFLGAKNVTTDGSGNANFKASFDTKVAPGQWITATTTDPGNNTSEFSQCIAVTASLSQTATAKADQNEIEAAAEITAIPEEFALLQNYPNPFNPETEIRFQLPQASHVVLKIYNLLGEEVRTLVDEQRDTGYHAVRWDGKDNNGKPVTSGVYLYQLRTESFSRVKKMSLLR